MFLFKNKASHCTPNRVCCILQLCLDEQRGTRIYRNIRLYFYSRRWYLHGAEEQSTRVRTREGVVGSRKNQWTTDFSQNLGTYIVYNSHVTGNNSSFSLVMVIPTPHFFVFHWLQFTSMSCLFPIGYFPKLTSMGWRICHHSPSSTTSIGQGDIPIITLLILSSARWSCQQHLLCSTPAGHGDIPVITLLILSSAGWSCRLR